MQEPCYGRLIGSAERGERASEKGPKDDDRIGSKKLNTSEWKKTDGEEAGEFPERGLREKPHKGGGYISKLSKANAQMENSRGGRQKADLHVLRRAY